MSRSSHRVALVGAGLLLLVSCRTPNFRGPQVQNPPEGYVPRPDLGQELRMFPGLLPIYHDAWIEGSVQEAGSIHINGYHGSLGAEEVQTALDARAALAPADLIVGGLERLVMDEREAWGWSERLVAPDGSVRQVAYRFAVAYDTVTYTVELETSQPEMTARPDSVRAIVASFAVGEITWNLPLLALLALALFIGVRALSVRAERRADQLRTITLAKVPEAERPRREPAAEGDMPAEGGTPGGGGGAVEG